MDKMCRLSKAALQRSFVQISRANVTESCQFEQEIDCLLSCEAFSWIGRLKIFELVIFICYTSKSHLGFSILWGQGLRLELSIRLSWTSLASTHLRCLSHASQAGEGQNLPSSTSASFLLGLSRIAARSLDAVLPDSNLASRSFRLVGRER